MMQRLVFMQITDNKVTFEKENGDTIIYPLSLVPPPYTEGDIIKAIVHDEDFIEFLELDIDEMHFRQERLRYKKSSLRERAKRSTNNA